MARPHTGAQPTALHGRCPGSLQMHSRRGEVTDLITGLVTKVSVLGSVPCHLLAFLTHPLIFLCLLDFCVPKAWSLASGLTLCTWRVPDPSSSDHTQISASSPGPAWECQNHASDCLVHPGCLKSTTNSLSKLDFCPPSQSAPGTLPSSLDSGCPRPTQSPAHLFNLPHLLVQAPASVF